MEDQVVEYHLVLTANPFSDSKAALTIYRNISILDEESKDLEIHFPGFHQIGSNRKHT